jgi:hypothetical protein
MNFKYWLNEENTDGQSKLMDRLKHINDTSNYSDGFGNDGGSHFLLTLYSAAIGYPKGTKIVSILNSNLNYWKDPDVKNLMDSLVSDGKLKIINKNENLFVGEPNAVNAIVKEWEYISKFKWDSENPRMSENLKNAHRRIGVLLGYKPDVTEDFLVHADNLHHNVPETILIGSARIYLIGNTLMINGEKQKFNIKITPDQVDMLKNMGTLSTLQKENIIGIMPPNKSDFSSSPRPAGQEFINLGVARVQLSKDSIHLNKTVIPLTKQQVQDIKDMLEI